MQMILTHDNRPLIQHLTVDEAIGILMAFGGYPVRPAARMPAAAAPVAVGRLGQPELGLDVPQAAQAAAAAKDTPPAASPAPVPASAPAAPAAEAHSGGKHGAGRHPDGYSEIAAVVGALAPNRTALVRLAKRLEISVRQTIHLAEATRGTSPRVLDRLRKVASVELGATACTQFDWPAMRLAVAARSRHLPRAWRVSE